MKKACFMGTAPSINLAPFDDNSYDFYYLNHVFWLPKKIDYHFDLHNTLRYKIDDPYFMFLKKNESKLYLTGIDHRFKKANIFPKDEILKKYGNYMTCSASWILAFLIEKGYKTIALYGIDMAMTQEQIIQKPSLMRMIGIAEGKGIGFEYPPNCKLFAKEKLYWNN